jgi:photosystem II stability/assembly factor-like uncharacterized protein
MRHTVTSKDDSNLFRMKKKVTPMKHRGIFMAMSVLLTVLVCAGTPCTIKMHPENTVVVISTADAGPGTLREALRQATSGTIITFDPVVFPPTNPATITLTSGGLPTITQGNLTIDASNTGVILDGSGMTEGSGLVIESAGNMIKGMQIIGFRDHGVLIYKSGHNVIGGINATPGGSCTGDCNLVSGNDYGVSLIGEGSLENIVSGNYIGTDVAGMASIGNSIHGIVIGDGAQNNLIGGYTDGERNLISGNIYDGVNISGSNTTNNTVMGNWIGLYLTEMRQAFPSDMAISPTYFNDCTLYVTTYSTGIHKSNDCGETWFEANAGLNKIGFRQVEIPPDAMDGNILYALSFDNHLFISTDGAANWSLVSTSIQGFDFRNLVLSASFTTDQTMYASAEGWSSEELGGGPGVLKSSDGGVTWRRIVDGMTNFNVRKVVVSTDPAAKEVLLALTYSGIEKSTDGGESWVTLAGPDTNLSDLVLSPTYASDQTILVTAQSGRIYSSTDGGANWTGLAELEGDPRYLTLSPNFASDRNMCLFSDEGGPHIYCSTDGGNTLVKHDPHLIGQLEANGTRIAFSPDYASDTTIYYLSIAGMSKSTDAAATWVMLRGLRDLGNVGGVSIGNGASHNTIGPGNVISNNHNGAAIIGAETANNVIVGNLFGTDLTGTFAQPNSGSGVSIHGGHNNLIGGRTIAERNIISGNTCTGVWLGLPDTKRNTVIGNYIGTDITGTVALGNGGEGGVVIIFGAQENIIGGEVEGEGNLISGNKQDGVYIGDRGTNNNLISGNCIGTDTSGKEPIGNSGHGVSVNSEAGLNIIGPGNTIAFNVDGVAIIGHDTIGNLITQNNIFNNNEVGIQNRDGGNIELSAPIITFIGSRMIQGTALPKTTIEVFSDEEDEGRIFEGSTIADDGGRFTFAMPAGRFTGPNVTTTATDLDSNTSNFSLPVYPPAPAISRELPGIVAPTQVSTEPTVVGTNLGLALFSVLFFGFTSSFFNAILEDYHDEMMSIFKRIIPHRFTDIFGRVGPSLHRMATKGMGRLLLTWLAVLLVVSIIESFLDPEIGILSPDRLGIIATLFVSATVVGALELGSDLYARRRWTPSMKAESKIQWIGIVLAVVCVTLSRALDFKPGYLYGIVGAVYLIPKFMDTIKRGKRATLVLLTVFVGGIVFWISTVFLPGSLAELEPIFLTIFLISLQWVFFELFPLTVTDGGDLLSWRRGVWFAFFLIVFFCFYHFVLNPNASNVQALQQNGVQTLLILIVVFGLATFLLWLLFPFRLRRKRAIKS